MDAVRFFAKNVTPPLLYGEGDTLPGPIGTASLLQIADRLFLISAAHNFEGAALDSFAIPENRQKGRAIGLSGEILRASATDRELIDVAVLALTSECAKHVRDAGWRALDLRNIAPASDHGVFVLCGYPTKAAVVLGDTIVSKLITAFTFRLKHPPGNVRFAASPDEAVDLFFHYKGSATDTDGVEIDKPRLHGASGANVWQYFEPSTDELWTPEKAIKAVAIQSTEVEDECFRAKSWGAPLSAIRTAYPELGELIPTLFGNVAFAGTLKNEH